MGYAVAFERMIKFINDLLPSNEIINQALRDTVTMYPEIAIRELVANALIHQNLMSRLAEKSKASIQRNLSPEKMPGRWIAFFSLLLLYQRWPLIMQSWK